MYGKISFKLTKTATETKPIINNITLRLYYHHFLDRTDAEAAAMLGMLDSAFLFAYAIAMFASGFIAERINLRYFLAVGMLLSGVFCYLFGIAKSYGIHNFIYLLFVQVFVKR